MSWFTVFAEGDLRIASRAHLVAAGATGSALTSAVKGGHLLRIRRDHYAMRGIDTHTQLAVRVGGLIGCVTALRDKGIFAFDASTAHINLDPKASRIRSPRSRFHRFDHVTGEGVELHWLTLLTPEAASEYSVGIIDALVQAVRCQHPWHAVGSLDNALHLGLIGEDDIAEIFNNLPLHLQYLRSHLDGRAEAGQESFLRMIVKDAGLDFELQVTIPGVGRLDILVEGCLALEADSRLAHDGWERHISDRGRDLELAKLGYMSLRPAYQHTMHRPELVRDAIIGLLHQRNHFRVTIL